MNDAKVGQFEIKNGSLYAPVEYMNERGNARVDEILEGRNTVFNMTAHLSPTPEIALLVNLQTDYAGWIGTKQLIDSLKQENSGV